METSFCSKSLGAQNGAQEDLVSAEERRWGSGGTQRGASAEGAEGGGPTGCFLEVLVNWLISEFQVRFSGDFGRLQ